MKKQNTIPLKQAKKWAETWRLTESWYNKYNECIAFNVPLDDLKDVLKEKGIVSVRAYLGVDENGEEKLMIVGVDKYNKDMLSSRDGENLDEDSGQIYDFTRPCPTTCDQESPLNGD